MAGFIVGIPTIGRWDMLRECLASVAASSVQPDDIIVIDNAGTFVPDEDSPPVRVVRPGYNLGVAASWNVLWSLAGNRAAVILNDDIRLGRGTLENMLASDGDMSWAFRYAAFRVTPALRERHMMFDERFWPWGYDDIDHFRRMTLAGYKINGVPDDGLEHMQGGSASHADWMNPFIQENYAKMSRKWGPEQNWQTPKLLDPLIEFREFGGHLPRHPDFAKTLLRWMGFAPCSF